MNTVITESTHDGEVSYDVFTKLIHDRILFLYDYIDDKAATDIVAALFYLDAVGNDKIDLYINCEGGDIRAVLMIYDVMQIIKSPIHTTCLGAASEAPAILLAAGTKGFRFATKSSFICISQLTIDGMAGDMTNLKISIEQLKRDNKKYIDLLSKLTGKLPSTISKDCERKKFMTPLQAKRYGIIDTVIGWSK